jgi:hypothetical protein
MKKICIHFQKLMLADALNRKQMTDSRINSHMLHRKMKEYILSMKTAL